MTERDQLERNEAIQHRSGMTVHSATRLLLDRSRHATDALYAFFRITDCYRTTGTSTSGLRLEE